MSGCTIQREEGGNRKQIHPPETARVIFIHILLTEDAESPLPWEEGAEEQRMSARWVPWELLGGLCLSGMLASFPSCLCFPLLLLAVA